RAFEELELLRSIEAQRPEHRHQRQRDQEPAEREDVRNPANCALVLLGNEQENQRTHQRREENDRKYVTLHNTVLSRQFSVASGCELRAASNQSAYANTKRLNSA